jgi:hypothetical protein
VIPFDEVPPDVPRAAVAAAQPGIEVVPDSKDRCPVVLPENPAAHERPGIPRTSGRRVCHRDQNGSTSAAYPGQVRGRAADSRSGRCRRPGEPRPGCPGRRRGGSGSCGGLAPVESSAT